MKKLNKLKKEGLEAANFRGHKMQRFESILEGISAVSNCDVCGKGLFVDTKPMPNGIDISGEAVALNCKPTYN